VEALSRGAAYAVFNDYDHGCCDIIRRNLDTLGFRIAPPSCRRMRLQRSNRLSGGQAFDLVFLEPPTHGAQQAMEALFRAGLIGAGGQVIVEHAWEEPPHAVEPLMEHADTRKYGDTGLSFFVPPRNGKDA
jgi:16S rRNA G966 N2-methylase RsmD